jgi:hypothetical protein
MWIYETVEEIIPETFFIQCHKKTLNGWQLITTESKQSSGFTLHVAKFKKYYSKKDSLKIYDEGYLASYIDNGVKCPYPENSIEELDWLSGYSSQLDNYSRSFDL